MIRINLLGEERIVDQSSKLILAGYVASVVVAVMIFIGLQTSLSSRVGDLGREVEDLGGQLAQLKKVTQEVRDLDAKKQELAQITSTLAKLKLSQEGPVQVMDDLNKAVPARAWLREVQEKGGVMTLVGMALNDHEVVSFMKGLETSDYFESVDLVESVTANLLKISALNHFTNRYTRYVVRTEEKQAAMKQIQDFAKRSGFKFENTDGPPINTSGGGAVSVMSTGALDSGSKLKGLKSGVFKAGSGRVEKVSAWSSVQPVPGKVFTIRAKVIYAGKLKALMNAGKVEPEVSTVAEPKQGA